MANDDNKIQIRNSTNDFLIFSKENGGDGVDVLVTVRKSSMESSGKKPNKSTKYLKKSLWSNTAVKHS